MALQLLCRNLVRDYTDWRAIFDRDADAHRAAGLTLAAIWRDRQSAETVFFLFDVADFEKANAFINAADAKAQAARSGVVEGSYHFLNTAPLYAKGA